MEDQPSTDSKPVAEKILPQTSMRFLLILIIVSAVIMTIVRMSSENAAFWTKIIVLLLATSAGCFLVYVILFLIASLMTSATEPIVEAIEKQPTDDLPNQERTT